MDKYVIIDNHEQQGKYSVVGYQDFLEWWQPQGFTAYCEPIPLLEADKHCDCMNYPEAYAKNDAMLFSSLESELRLTETQACVLVYIMTHKNPNSFSIAKGLNMDITDVQSTWEQLIFLSLFDEEDNDLSELGYKTATQLLLKAAK